MNTQKPPFWAAHLHAQNNSTIAALLLLLANATGHAENAREADTLADSIGVCTHFAYPGVYQNASLQSLLGASGIRHVRDSGGAVEQALYASYGIKTLVPTANTSTTLSDRVARLGAAHVLAMEGLNEPENWPRTYNGLSDNTSTMEYPAVRAFQRDLYDLAKLNAAAKNKPLLSPAMGWYKNAYSLVYLPFDAIAFHPYPNGKNPGNAMVDMECIPHSGLMVSPGQSRRPLWATETGYHNAIQSNVNHRAITETAAGKYIPRMLVGHFKRGIEKTYVYELVDEGGNLANLEQNFGLIRRDLTLKPAYHAIKNLIGLVADPGSRFVPGALNLTLSGSVSNVERVLLQKRNGEFYVLLWQEVLSCNHTLTPPSDISIAAAPVTLSFGGVVGLVSVYNNLDNPGNPNPITYTNVSTVSLSVPDEIVVVRLQAAPGSGTSGNPTAATGPDLVISNAWTTPSDPKPGDTLTFRATVTNRGTAPVTTATQVFMSLDSGAKTYTASAPALNVGASVDVAAGTTWTAVAGNHTIRCFADNSGAVAESNERNNHRLLTTSVVASRLEDGCTHLANWTQSPPNWAVASADGLVYFENASGSAAGKLSRPVSLDSTSWRLDFEYDWRYGGAASNLFVYADLLDSSNNGYRVRVRQGDGGVAGNLPQLVEIFKMSGGTQGSRLGAGAGYDQPGWNSRSAGPVFKRVRLIYDRATTSLSAYIDLDRDGVLEQVVAPIKDTTSPTISFTKLELSAFDGQGAGCRPAFDNIRLDSGTFPLVPAGHFTDGFGNLANWSGVSGWSVTSAGGLTFAHNPTTNAGGSMTHTFVTTLNNGWNLGFDYDWRWGGGTANSLRYGHSNLRIFADVLDSGNNGYRVLVRQGDDGDPSKANNLVEIYKVAGGVQGALLGKGCGYNQGGWNSAGKPQFKRIAFSYNRATQQLAALIDANGDGAMETAVAPVSDTSVSSFTKLVLSASDGQNATCAPALDNIEVGLLP